MFPSIYLHLHQQCTFKFSGYQNVLKFLKQGSVGLHLCTYYVKISFSQPIPIQHFIRLKKIIIVLAKCAVHALKRLKHGTGVHHFIQINSNQSASHAFCKYLDII